MEILSEKSYGGGSLTRNNPLPGVAVKKRLVRWIGLYILHQDNGGAKRPYTIPAILKKKSRG